jgi:hypothetical protein
MSSLRLPGTLGLEHVHEQFLNQTISCRDSNSQIESAPACQTWVHQFPLCAHLTRGGFQLQLLAQFQLHWFCWQLPKSLFLFSWEESLESQWNFNSISDLSVCKQLLLTRDTTLHLQYYLEPQNSLDLVDKNTDIPPSIHSKLRNIFGNPVNNWLLTIPTFAISSIVIRSSAMAQRKNEQEREND